MLTIIFEKSWRTGKVPEDWRKASVSPVFWEKTRRTSQETTGVTSVPGKVMEQLLLDIISKHGKEKKAISSQHGFTEGILCLTNNRAFCGGKAVRVDKGSGWSVDVAYLDFSKVFDTVSHNIVTGGGWVEDWLNVRAQRVVISGTEPGYRPVPRSVPQRSVLGPVIFPLFISYLDERKDCTLSRFADDMKLWGVADTPLWCAASQWDLDREESHLSSTKANRVLQLGKNHAVLSRRSWGSWSISGCPRASSVPWGPKRPLVPWDALGRTFPSGWGRSSSMEDQP